ncbi:DUF6155 family protein [Neobacillus mesonae]|uniref:DUF6155 family protein n=1 Tax=Neobacillus mesonae TaxID=1193713 RepID=UPI00203AD539|nr:DUF6155 family protein [Neobacillus mesonae]MCM3570344.1 DUF6155 family protein [Neobacillus mesonae]
MKIKITELKKHLKELDQKELIELVVEMFKANKDVQSFLSSKFLGDGAIEFLFKEARKKVENEFFPERGDGKLRLAEAKKVILNFRKVTNDDKRTVDLKLFYVEQGVKYTNSFGDINENFYISMEKMFHEVALECDRNEALYREFSNRLHNVVGAAEGTGWGFYEGLADSYYLIEWVHEDEE